jgi:hypothetical protein
MKVGNFPTLLPALAEDTAIHKELELSEDEVVWLKKHGKMR